MNISKKQAEDLFKKHIGINISGLTICSGNENRSLSIKDVE
jgi:hypothetical protein